MTEWQLTLFKKSIKKKAKWNKLEAILDISDRNRYLDIGSGTGAVDYYLRKKGGTWVSLEPDESKAVETRRLVGNNVIVGDGTALPFKECFDGILALDVIEHIEDDEKFIKEMTSVLKPKGDIYITTPYITGWQVLNKLKNWLGMTPDKYQHVRLGYSLKNLEEKLQRLRLEVIFSDTYSKFFTEFIELMINVIYLRLSKGEITPACGGELNRFSFRIYQLFYPVLSFFSNLDRFLLFSNGYGLLIKARKREESVI
jgi:SAM-dependent methyltransferase